MISLQKRIRSIFLALLLSGMYSCSLVSKDNISKDPSVFTEEDQKAVQTIVQSMKSGEDMALNFANDHHYRFYKKQLYNSGVTEETNPRFFKVLEQTREQHLKTRETHETLLGSMLNYAPTTDTLLNEITSFVSSGQVNYATAGLLSYPYEDSIITGTISIGLYNQLGQPMGIPQAQSGYTYAQLTDLEAASSGSTTSSNDSVFSLMTYFYQDKQGNVRHGMRKAVNSDIVDTIVNLHPVPCILNQPVSQCNGNPCTNNQVVTVCMTRQTPACTYCNPGFSNNLMFPLQGYVKYNGNVNVGSNGKPNGNAFYTVTLARKPAGGGCQAIPISGNFWDYVTVNGDSLGWNISQASFQNNCLQSGDSVLFQMTICVMVGNQPAFATITNARDATPPAVKVAPIQIVSGCLAGGTRIMMADGSLKIVEDIQIGEKIMSANMQTLTVEYNTIGREEKASVRLKDSKHHSLLVTAAHPVLTPNGVVLAGKLKTGDKILTYEGEALLTEVVYEEYDKTVWNLAAGIPADGIQFTRFNTTFYAEGILVGDHKMQNYHFYSREMSREEVLELLPEEWHSDYLNSVK